MELRDITFMVSGYQMSAFQDTMAMFTTQTMGLEFSLQETEYEKVGTKLRASGWTLMTNGLDSNFDVTASGIYPQFMRQRVCGNRSRSVTLPFPLGRPRLSYRPYDAQDHAGPCHEEQLSDYIVSAILYV